MPEPTTIVSALLIAIVPSVAYLLVLNAIDRYEKEPWTILMACVGLGAVVAPILVVLVLVLLGRPAALPPAFAPGLRPDPVVGIVEEVVKGLLLVGLVRSVRDEFDDVLDGVIYGAALGAGFGAAESFLYVVGGTGQLGGDTVAPPGRGRGCPPRRSGSSRRRARKAAGIPGGTTSQRRTPTMPTAATPSKA